MKLPLRFGQAGTLHDADGNIVNRFGASKETNEFIMLACNSHYGLIGALQAITFAIKLEQISAHSAWKELIKACEAALSKAQPSTEKENADG